MDLVKGAWFDLYMTLVKGEWFDPATPGNTACYQAVSAYKGKRLICVMCYDSFFMIFYISVFTAQILLLSVTLFLMFLTASKEVHIE